MNKYNKLVVEVHSKLKEDFKVQKIQLRFNDPTLDQVIAGEFTLSKASPILLEREIFKESEEIEAELGFVIEGELANDGRDVDLLRANVDFLEKAVDDVDVLG